MPNLMQTWEHDPEELGYERAARPGRPVVLVVRSHTGKLGLAPPYAQAFAALAEAFARSLPMRR